MSLSSFLLPSKSKTAVDAELDALFKTNEAAAGPSSRPAESTTEKTSKDSRGTGKKRKGESSAVEEPVKRRKSESQKAAPTPTPAAKVKTAKPKEQKKAATSKKDNKGKAKISDDEESEENADLEDGYLNARVQESKERDEDDAEVENDSDEDEDEDADAGAGAIPIHESLKKDKKSSSRSGPKLKYVPAEETPEQRNLRTIFVGNLSTDVAQKRPLQKQLHRHILQYIPDAKIESTRFRSVAFATPTANPSADSSDGKTPSKKTPSSDPKSARQHDLSRTSAWRDRQTQSDDVSLKADEKKFLTTAQKKKIAFINQEFHSSADTVNAYIVFAHPIPKEELEKRPKNLPPLKEVLDPYEAAKKAVVKCDGTTFMDRLIRVDLVSGKGALAAKETEGLAAAGADPKLSIFVGNLDFASKEEDLRVFFEGVITAEKGTPLSPGEDASGKKTGWVTRVRIVRDKDTQMGKGFAYIQFADRECVDEILAMEEGKIKFAKRKLRVQRCKTLPGSSTSTRQITSDNKQKPSTDSASAKKRPAPTPIVIPTVPRGDPSLGEKLAGLSKDARKQAKSSDADRVARRLAKKKARLAMAKAGPSLKLGGGAGGKDGKERVRVRKSGRDDGGKGKPVKKAKSGRVRSEKAIQNRNRKREA